MAITFCESIDSQSAWPVEFKPATQTRREDLLKRCENKSKKGNTIVPGSTISRLTGEADPLLEHKKVGIGDKREVTPIYSPVPLPSIMQHLLDLDFLVMASPE